MALAPKKKPTIWSMEKLTGFSRGTISRAFYSDSNINPATREAILRKAAEIGYMPNSGVGATMAGKIQRWGLLLPHLKNPWICELTEAIDQQARGRNVVLVTALSHYNATIEKKYLQLWMRGEMQGIIVASMDIEDNYLTYLHAQSRFYPVVFIYPAPRESADYVDVENYSSSKGAMQYLYDMGHRRIGFISQYYPHVRASTGFRAYCAFLGDHEIPILEEYIHIAPIERAAKSAWTAWKGMKHRPTAVLCSGDSLACALMMHVLGDGQRVPEDLSIIGHDNSEMAARMNITTIGVDINVFAQEIVALLERPRGENRPKIDHRMVPSSLILRQSVAKINPERRK